MLVQKRTIGALGRGGCAGTKEHYSSIPGADPGILNRGFKLAEGGGMGFDLCSLTNFS